MRLRSVAAGLPSRTVTNADILGMVAGQSSACFDGDLDDTLRKIDSYLRYTGSNERRWLDAGERPLDLLADAAATALDQADVHASEVDLLIYTGIGRGFIEPGGAYHCAAALGFDKAHCFDIIDACMSWTRAVQVAESMLCTGRYRTAVIVNAEFSLRMGGMVFPQLFALPNAAALASTFPAYTLGEAATATVVSAEDDDPWDFRFLSRPDLSPLCNVTLPGYEGFCEPSDKLAANGVGTFSSFGAEMHEVGAADTLAVFRSLDVDAEKVSALFTHASSKRQWQLMADSVGLGNVIHHVFPTTGNIVSASVPTAMASAIDSGVLQRGERVVGWVGSAGMSFGAFSFIY
ncbi:MULTISPECIES: 3-oxoacyl-[acyl-carrier-protein] synthase III C-terminal domain-containing protein [unclassified Nocardia]|uniref:3-oxoacyl-[acyl-carrier-protein] synthase III C-terminal domain-containing protein n=1 Tax=unclassified Nocardia TaxID=2637762 RepID=UPI00278C0BFF|nr:MULTISPECIES: 3-oxoacyl-[acyl-carrier-protein] synthase III C-terminal domain-containing protein [unclassified Nocardia]